MFGKKREKMSLPRGLEKVFERLLSSPRHLAIIGGTGAGKTTLVKLLLRLAEKEGFRSIIVDWHGEYHEIPSLAYPARIQYDTLPEVLSHLVEEESRTPGYSTYLAVSKALETSLEKPNIEKLVRTLEKLAEVHYSLRLGATAAAARLEAIKDYIELAERAEPQRGTHRLDLSRLGYTAAKTLASIYTFTLYSFLKRSKDREKTIVVLEESQNYSRPSKFLRELRHTDTKIIEIMQYLPPREEQAHSILSNTNIVVGATGAYSAQLVSKLHLNPDITTLENGEFLILAGKKSHKIRLF